MIFSGVLRSFFKETAGEHRSGDWAAEEGPAESPAEYLGAPPSELSAG